jgi:small-conductance mechanosensitive channel
VTVTAGVAYDTDLAHAYRVLSQAVSALPGVLSEPPMLVSFEGFDEISIRMVFRFWFEWRATTAIDLQTRATEAIMEAARREGISLPVSVRAMVLHNPAESTPEMTTTR